MRQFHQSLARIWLIFAAIFLAMGAIHLYLSTQGAPDLRVASRPMEPAASVQILGADIDQPLREFAKNFNGYVHAQNDASRFENLMAMAGYILASLVSLISFCAERRTVAEIEDSKAHGSNPDPEPAQAENMGGK